MARPDEAVYDYSYTARKTLPVEAYKERYSYSTAGVIQFYGRALPGKSIGSACWQIKRYVLNGATVTGVNWASSCTRFIHIWSGVGAVGTTFRSYSYT